MAPSHGTSVSSNSFSRWASHDILLFKYHFLLHILRFIFYFSDNIMAAMASKQQTTALFLSTNVTRTRRHRTDKKTDKPDGKPVLCQRIFSSVFVQFFTQLICTVELRVYGVLNMLQCWCTEYRSGTFCLLYSSTIQIAVLWTTWDDGLIAKSYFCTEENRRWCDFDLILFVSYAKTNLSAIFVCTSWSI